MNVYSYLDPDGPDLDFKLLPLWEESWRRQGWTPRLLTIRDAKRHPAWERYPGVAILATAQAGGGWFSRLDLLNDGFKAKQPRKAIEHWPSIGLWWGTKRGLNKSIKLFPSVCPGIKEHLNGIEFLFSVRGMDSMEQIEQCLAARKKS